MYEENATDEFAFDFKSSKGPKKTVYYGFDSSKMEMIGSQNAATAIDRSNYALMTFDKKRDAFRMVPI